MLAGKIKALSRKGKGRIVVRGLAAAFLYGAPLLDEPERIDISGPGISRTSAPFGKDGPSVRLRPNMTKRKWGFAEIGGIKVASRRQALLDCLLWESGESATVAACWLLRSLTRGDDLHREDPRIARAEREVKADILAHAERTCSVRELRRVSKRLERLSARCESPGESRALWFFAYWGFPQPRQQVRIGSYFVDFLFEQARLIVEFDGWGKIADDPAAMRRIFERDRFLVQQGWKVVHVTWQDLDRPDLLANRLAVHFPLRHRPSAMPQSVYA